MATLQVADPLASNVTIAVDGVRYQFEDGYLDVDDTTADDIRRQGRTLFPHLGIHIVEGRHDAGKSLARMSLGELQEAAAARDIDTEGLTKAQIRELLEAEA